MPQGPDKSVDPRTGEFVSVTRDASGNVVVPEPEKRPEVISSHSPTYSSDQIDAGRNAVLAAEISRFTAKRPGATAAEIAEVRAAGLAKWNEALELGGHDVPKPEAELSPEDAKRIKQAGVMADPREFALDFQQKQTLDPERYAGLIQGSTQWARDLGMGRETGSAVLNYLAAEGPRIAKMSNAERAAYAEQQQTLGIKLYGLDGFKALRDRALASLKHDEISSGIRSGAIGHSVQLLSLLDLNAKSNSFVVNKGRIR
jgi:hypothetical protein